MAHDAEPDLRQQSGPHVFVDDLDAAVLSDGDFHHLHRSLRLRAGDALTASDGAGRWRPFHFDQQLTPAGDAVVVAPPAWTIELALALTKGAKPELAVQKATELGVDRIVVFQADHSVVRWQDEKIERSLVRLQRVAREAAMQSRQVRLPTVDYVADVDYLQTQGFARADFGGRPIDASVRSLAIGPEGGWSERERSVLVSSVDLGRTVLRAETAAIAGAVRMTSLRPTSPS